MVVPDEQRWLRIEALAAEIAALSPEEAAARISLWAGEGESSTVLTLLGAWLELPPPTCPWQSGSTIAGRYRLGDRLGEGGMGTVWSARQDLIGREVALKIVHPALSTPALRRRFLGEMELLGRLDHPGIVRIYDAGIFEDASGTPIPFFAMERVEGERLDRWAAARRSDLGALVRAMARVCRAVQAAHECGIVHRDLKPANILVRPDGSPVVLDFGVARIAGAALGDDANFFAGTPVYAAPEQHLLRDRDFRSGESVDVYALGVVLCEVASGHRPFDMAPGAPLETIRRVVLEGRPRRLRDLRPDIPEVLDEIVARALRSDPADRYYTVSALGRALESAAAEWEAGVAVAPRWKPGTGEVVPGTSWRLAAKLGEGGVGEVWLGERDDSGERQVFKFCDSEAKTRSLKREQTVYRLLKERIGEDPHFVRLREASLDDPPWYLAMEHVEARDLPGWVDIWPGGLAAVPMEVRIEIVAQAAETLQRAHDAGILHRDVKPANLLVRTGTPAASPDSVTEVHVYVTDFGIGQILAEDWLGNGTRMGFTRTLSADARPGISGSLLYVAPEVLEGQPATARSDLYALGVVFWQLLVGSFSVALDPTAWASRIEDPLLRSDLERCLAGDPTRRWAGAGELAARLRELPERRVARERQRAEIQARERAAYRRGVLRTAGVGAVVVGVLAGLAWIAWQERRAADSARARGALEEAAMLDRSDLRAGRVVRGRELLRSAVSGVTDGAAFRSAAARVWGMTDLAFGNATEIEAPRPDTKGAGETIPGRTNETARAWSNDGRWVAIALDRNGLEGRVDFVETVGDRRTVAVVRPEFPWLPVADPALFRFAPSQARLAVGGAATSRHVLVLRCPEGDVEAYLFHPVDPLTCAWHPSGRLLATGCADSTVRVWYLPAARAATGSRTAGHAFDLPPRLEVPAIDDPVVVLRGHRGPVRRIAFDETGRWLAAIDALGYLRVYGGFDDSGSPTEGGTEFSGPVASAIGVRVETRLAAVEDVDDLVASGGGFVVRRRRGVSESVRPVPGEMPSERYVGRLIDRGAWNGDGESFCVATLTGLQWFRRSPLESMDRVSGNNPIGIVSDSRAGVWVVVDADSGKGGDPSRRSLAHLGLRGRVGEQTAKLPSPARSGQAAQIGLAASDDGRLAVYHGRRILLYAGMPPVAVEPGVVADGGTGVFQELHWDAGGRLLAATFRESSGDLRIESWSTSATGFLSEGVATTWSAPIARFASAHDGRRWITRDATRGISVRRVDGGLDRVLDDSVFARQDAPIAVTSDGSWLAYVTERTRIRLIEVGSARAVADLEGPRADGLTRLDWHASGRYLAAFTEGGFLQVWNLGPWQDWLAESGWGIREAGSGRSSEGRR